MIVLILRCIIGGNLPPIIINGVANTVALTTESIENTRVIFALITRRSSVQIRPPQPSLRTLKFQRFQGFFITVFALFFTPKMSKTIKNYQYRCCTNCCSGCSFRCLFRLLLLACVFMSAHLQFSGQ